MVKNIFICDIDGVLCNYPSDEFLIELSKEAKFKFKDLKSLKQDVDINTYNRAKKNYRYNGSKFEMEIFPKAINVINKLFKNGVHIIIQTSRPTDNYIKSNTFNWLKNAGINFDQLILNPYKHETHYFNPDQKIVIIDDISKNLRPYKDQSEIIKLLYDNKRLGESAARGYHSTKIKSWVDAEIHLNKIFNINDN